MATVRVTLHLTDDPLIRRDGRGKAYTERPCDGCNELAWLRKAARYCSPACARPHLGRSGENNPRWTGDDAGYETRHKRVRRGRKKATGCYNRQLGLRDCTSTIYQWSQVHGSDGLDPLDYVELCKSCHNRYDGTGEHGSLGSKQPRAVLTEEIVAEIRSRPVVRGSIAAWAREFGAAPGTIRDVVLGKSWAHVLTP